MNSRLPLWLLLVTLLLGAATAHAMAGRRADQNGTAAPAREDWQAPGWHEGSIRVGDAERWFRTYVPRRMQQSAPVVVLLHGGTQSMRKIFERAGGTNAWPDVAEQEGMLLVVPNATNPDSGDPKGDKQNWNDLRPQGSERRSGADDVGFIRALLGWVQANYAIDPRRIYVTGASNGGNMTYRLLLEMPEYFAAAAVFIANLLQDGPALRQPSLATPLLIANGTADPMIKWEGGQGRGSGTTTVSSEENLSWWLRANRAGPRPAREEPLPDSDPEDGCRIYKTAYVAAPGGAPVVFYRLEGGGHAMPSSAYPLPDKPLVRRLIGNQCRDAEGAQLAWEFMRDKRRDTPASRRP